MFDDGSPIYRQIAERIRHEILTGDLREGDPVMSTNAYGAFYRINPATVAKAFHELAAEGVLVKRRGVGMFVADDAPERLRRQRRARFFTDVVDPVAEQAAVLGIPLAEVIDRLRARATAP